MLGPKTPKSVIAPFTRFAAKPYQVQQVRAVILKYKLGGKE
jgi:hypothetical protein